MNRWFNEDKSKAEFFIIYVREAHATDGSQAQQNVRDGVLVANHKTIEEREEAAKHCAEELGIKIPILMDSMDDKTERAYQGWPDRIYIVGKDGTIAYAGAKGPRGFNPKEAQELLHNLTGG